MTLVNKIVQYVGICLGMLLPLILGLVSGFNHNSYSEYYFTDSKYIFISFLTFIGLTFLTMGKKWFLSGISLILLSYFNYIDYKIFHYLMAAVFFINSMVVITTDKRFKIIGIVMIFLSPIVFVNLYFFELIEVLLISLFHLLYLNLKLSIKN